MSKGNYSAETRISRLISTSNSPVGRLVSRAHRMIALQKAVNEVLPADCRDYCRPASYRNGVLKLQADSAAWATKLRFQQPLILNALKQRRGFADLRKIQVKVIPNYDKPKIQVAAKPISAASAEHLRETADSIDQPELSEALRRIAKPR